MYRTLIVPLDGSELAERALPYAAGLARSSNGRLILVRVVSAAAVGGTIDGGGWEEMQPDTIAEAEQYLTTVSNRLSSPTPIEIVVYSGRAADGILEGIASLNADAVVMATHGRTG